MSRSEYEPHVSAHIALSPHKSSNPSLTRVQRCAQDLPDSRTRTTAPSCQARGCAGDNEVMPSEQTKSPTEQPAQPAAVAAYPPPYNGAHFAPLPPGAYPPPYYAYAPIADPNHDPNAPGGAPVPYFMAFAPPPPGMVYAYAPPGAPGQGMSPYQHELNHATQLAPAVQYSYPPPPPNAQLPVASPPTPRPKRKQVKMAVSQLMLTAIS